jgi:hypothetical protein
MRITKLTDFIFSAMFFALAAIAFTPSANAQAAYRMAQMKSQRMANIGFQRLRLARKSPYSIARNGMRHVMPFRRPLSARREGVGFSLYSPSQALRNACHYGSRPIIASSVARGRDGYYATVFYR